MPPSVAVYVAREVARALHYAHTLVLPDGTPGGVVHRDVTPSNIMLLKAGGVKILDFGIAKAAAAARPSDGGRPRLAGQALVPVAGAGARPGGRSPLGHLLARHRAVGDGRGAAAVHGRERRRDAAERADAPDRRALAAPRRGPGRAGRDRGARAGTRAANRYESAEAFANELDRLPGRDAGGGSGDPESARGAGQRSAAEAARRSTGDPDAARSPRPARPSIEVRGPGRACTAAIAPSRRRKAPRVPLPTLVGIFLHGGRRRRDRRPRRDPPPRLKQRESVELGQVGLDEQVERPQERQAARRGRRTGSIQSRSVRSPSSRFSTSRGVGPMRKASGSTRPAPRRDRSIVEQRVEALGRAARTAG